MPTLRRRRHGGGRRGGTGVTPYFERGGVTIFLGDFREVMLELPPESFEAVVTDPPYPKEYLSLWEPLGVLSARVLARGGSLLSVAPHYALPDVLAAVGQSLKYRWMLCMEQASGPHPRMAMGIEVCWKPVGWWVKDAWPIGRGFKADLFHNQHPTAKLHKWEQNLSWAEACLRFVPAGRPVLDPMLGSGTLLLAARTHGYPSVGIDVDEAACEIAANRLQQDILPLEVSA